MAHTFKVGDECVPNTREMCSSYNRHDSAYIKITRIEGKSSYLSYNILNKENEIIDSCSGCFTTNDLKLKNNSASFMSNLIEKFKFLTKSEPEKSFIKAGIIDANGNLTTDGQALLIQYLLEKTKDDFNKDVVQPLLKDSEEK